MLAVSACGLIAGIALVPSNLIELTFQNTPTSGMATHLKITAIASVGLTMILASFFEGLRGLARDRHLEDKLTRWPTAFVYQDQLTAQEYESLIEVGPSGEPRTAQENSSQLDLFPKGERSPRTGWLTTTAARMRRSA